MQSQADSRSKRKCRAKQTRNAEPSRLASGIWRNDESSRNGYSTLAQIGSDNPEELSDLLPPSRAKQTRERHQHAEAMPGVPFKGGRQSQADSSWRRRGGNEGFHERNLQMGFPQQRANHHLYRQVARQREKELLEPKWPRIGQNSLSNY